VKTKYSLACYAIVLIVLLRIGIGWHFFYEGVSKFDPASNFSAEGFLAFAKGPTAEMYYWMLPDLDGVNRLELADIQDENGRDAKTFLQYENAWKDYFKQYLLTYSPLIRHEADAEEFITLSTAGFAEWQEANLPSDNEGIDLVEARTIFFRYLNAMRLDAADLELEVLAFRASRDRFLETRRTIRNNTSFEQERRWRQMMGLRYEASTLIRMLTAMGDGLQSDLGRVADPELAGRRGQIVTAPERELFPANPFVQMDVPAMTLPIVDADILGRMHVKNWAVTFALTAIGLCLMIGFCTRLAALGGVAFLVNVVLTTYPVPGVYPEIPSIIGNFMFVSKDTVELLALLVLAAIPSGRWAGLDYFLWNYGGKQIMGLFCPRVRAGECG